MIKQQCRCGAKYGFPEDAVGRRAKCKKCGTLFTVRPPPPKEETGQIPISDNLGVLDSLAAAAEDADKTEAEGPSQLQAGASTGFSPPTVIIETGGESESSERPVGAKGYGQSLLWTFLFPSSPGNLITFVILCMLLSLSRTFLQFAGCIGSLGQLVVLGWYCAFRLEVISGAAAGEEDLPSISGDDGVMDGIIVPLFNWIGSWVVVLAPAFIYLSIALSGGLIRPIDFVDVGGGLASVLVALPVELHLFGGLVLAGLVFWPIIVLCISIGGFSSLIRLDLITATMIRSFPFYFITVVIVFGSFGIDFMLTSLLSSQASAGNARLSAISGTGMGLTFGATVVTVYLEIVAMRAIGLYYHHFKHKFAWDWG